MEIDSQLLSVVVGIVSSLIATAIFIGVSEMSRRLVFPWIEDKVYRGVRLDGSWRLKMADGSDMPDSLSIEMEIEQWGDKIFGTCVIDDKDDKTVYRMKGVVKNMYFMAYMEPISSKMIDASALLFHIEHEKGSLLLCGSLLHKDKPGKVGSWQNLIFTQRRL